MGDQGTGNDAAPEELEHSEGNISMTAAEQEEAVAKELDNITEEFEELESLNGDGEEGKGELKDEIYKDLQNVDQEIHNLEGSDDHAVEQKKEELYEVEDKLMKELLDEDPIVVEDDYTFEEEDGGDDDDAYESTEERKEDVENIKQDITDLEEGDDDGRLAEQKEASIEFLKEIEEAEEEELEAEEEIEDKLEDLHNGPPDAFIDGESKSNWAKLRNRISSEGNEDVAKYEVWLALPLVMLLLAAAYRCTTRRSRRPSRSPHNGSDGYDDIQLVGDSTMM